MPEAVASSANPLKDRAARLAAAIRHRLLAVLESLGGHRWLVLCLFQFGLVAGLVVVLCTRDRAGGARVVRDAEPTGSGSSGDAPPPAPPPSKSFELAELGRADALLRQERYELALAIYRSLYTDTAAPIPDLLRFRVAMCLEGLAKRDAAITEFGVVAGNRNPSALAAAAQLARARLWMRKHETAEAKQSLSDLVLRSAQPDARNTKLLAEAIYRLALIAAHDALGPELPGPLSQRTIAHATDDLSGYALDWTTDASSGAGLANDSPLTVEPAGAQAHEIALKGTAARAPTWNILQQVAYAAQRQCRSTPQAQQLLAARTAILAVEHLPLSVVLSAFTNPLGVLWELGENDVHFCSEQEVSDEALKLYRVRLAERELHDALATDPDHPLNAWAQLELANLAYSQERFAEAISLYEKLATSATRVPVAPEARYNLGVALLRLNRRDEARQAFYLVVDGSPSHPLAALAYFNIGQAHLQQGAFEQAVQPLRQATKIATSAETRRAAAAGLASAYLLMDNSEAALAVLIDYREELSEPPYRNVAAFLTSYARVKTSSSRRQAQREARVLSWALVGASQESVLGTPGVLLMGHAYRDLGMGEEMVALYQKATDEGIPAAFLPEMSYDIAEHAVVSGDRERAVEIFTELASNRSGTQAQLARFRLAEMALDDGRLDDCLNWGRRALFSSTRGDRADILKLLGRAFERNGSDQDAALCFAGQVPESLAGRQRTP